MSMLGMTLLNEIVIENEITSPADVLNQLRLGVVKGLGQLEDNDGQRDGIDLVFCKWERNSRKLTYASANEQFVIIENGQMNIYKGDKQPAGYHTGALIPFTEHELVLSEGSLVYTFSDGFQDQFGGDKGDKFKFNRMKELLSVISTEPLNEQKERLKNQFYTWKNSKDETGHSYEQIDDVLIFCVKL
ncbi:MAG: hypothetical protein C0594_04175 [Marinilabiliales bacterium]|nr:MAG: hypothetical protein C0594_04175 [Marinilabiliales bacterium]